MDGTARIEVDETLAIGRHYRIRQLNVAPGARLGVRVHRHRTEQYVVLVGEARIILGEDVVRAGPDASIIVPFGMPHRLENAGRGTLSLLEVQVGSRFEEDDAQIA